MDPSTIREKIGRFRILVVGRANAGKTTILQRVCNTRENPVICNSAGEKIDPAVLEASRDRGLHDIENEMTFESNPGFIFHDSRGFEAGGVSEFDKVKAFIASRSKEARLKDRLHVIWYCIPMDEACRSFTKGETKFFSQCDTGNIPVIVLFTKFDALYDEAYARLKSEGVSMKEAGRLAPKHAEESFATGSQLKFLYHSKDIRHPPKCHICLPNMDSDDADCGLLIERTAETLDNEVLKQLFVSTQQTNLEICMKYAVEISLLKFMGSAETTTSDGHEKMIRTLGTWFPNIWVADFEDGYRWEYYRWEYYRRRERRAELAIELMKTDNLYNDEVEEIQSRLLPVVSSSSPLENIFQLGSAAIIIFENSFYIFDKRNHLQGQEESVPSFYVALEQYIASPHAAAVKEDVGAAVQAYEEAVTTAAHAYEEAVKAFVYPYQGNLPAGQASAAPPTPAKVSHYTAWMAKLPFKPFKRKAKEAIERSQQSIEHSRQSFERSQQSFARSKEEEKESSCSQAKAELIKAVLEITLNHRLPRPLMSGDATQCSNSEWG